MSAAVGDSVVAFPSVIRAVAGHGADLPGRRDPAEQIGRHRRIDDMATGDLNGTDLQRLFVDPGMDLPPDPSFRAAMLADMPLAFIFDLDASAVDQ